MSARWTMEHVDGCRCTHDPDANTLSFVAPCSLGTDDGDHDDEHEERSTEIIGIALVTLFVAPLLIAVWRWALS